MLRLEGLTYLVLVYKLVLYSCGNCGFKKTKIKSRLQKSSCSVNLIGSGAHLININWLLSEHSGLTKMGPRGRRGQSTWEGSGAKSRLSRVHVFYG